MADKEKNNEGLKKEEKVTKQAKQDVKKEEENKKKVVKILEEIAKRQYEIGSNVKKKLVI